MQSMFLFYKILILLFGVAISVHAVPPVLNYAGQVAVNGEAFDGNGSFKFALVNADGTTTYWSNDGTSVDGSEPQASVTVSVNAGLYAILLGNTAQQGMGAIDPALFAQHTDAKLRVWFSDGVNGFQQLSPDRPFASVPYAFSAGTAQTAGSAPIANGAVNLDMLSQDVKTQINALISHSRLSQELVADINATIGMNRLSTEVTEKLNQEKTTTNYNAPSVGSLLAVPYGSDAPAGYSLYQRGGPKELVWEEKAPVSVAGYAFDGVEVLDGKIYFIGGANGSGRKNIAERYDPETNTWEILSPMSEARHGVASAVLNGKVYAIGGQGLSSVEVYDPSTESWSSGVALPSEVNHGTAITVGVKIYLIGGRTSSNQDINQVLCFDTSTNQWQAKANMPTARNGVKLVWFDNRIWAIAGFGTPANSTVESYDPQTDTWRTEKYLPRARNWPAAWVSHERIYVGGLEYGSHIDYYDPANDSWIAEGNLPESKYVADSVVLNNTVYVIAGATASGVYSNKVYAADLNASMEGVYDLYRKDGDAPVGTPVVQSEYADGSVTANKIASNAITTNELSEQILKYLKPEITSQPQAQTVYEDSNVSFSVTAEGKFLTYQWKKDGADLTGETNATLNITDANATLHDGNYSVVVSNDFGSVESGQNEILINDIGPIEGLVGWWKFDEGSGTVAYDSSGNGHDGNLTNGPTWTTGKIGGALSFDGVDDHIIMQNFLGIGGRNPRSITAWIKTTTSNSTICEYGKDQDSQRWTFIISAEGYLRNEVYNGALVASSKINDGNWHFVCSILPPNSTKIGNLLHYADGIVEEASFSSDKHFSTTLLEHFIIGRRTLGNSKQDFYTGLIDDVRIYDRALSAEEVQALYNLGQ
jgi:N-acetylneuraminic acid mutarotase